MRVSAFKLFGLGAALVLLTLAVGNRGQVGVAQADCTVTVEPGQSIQEAINKAPAGAVICLTEGTWQENIIIEKSLTLRGEKEKTVIDGVHENYPVVWVRALEEQEVVVQLEGLRITGAEGECADIGKGICAAGVLFQGSVQAIISGSTISGNRLGIVLWDSAQATISGSVISWNTWGIGLGGSAQATITNSTISKNGADGIWLGNSAQVTISDSTISENGASGLWLEDSAQATISNSTLFENGGDGIVLRDSVQATISGNLFTGNRGCGIYSDSSKEVRGEANKMADNGNDLCGNLPGSLRLPLREPTEEEITWPDERYKSLQEAVDALLPGGRLRLQVGEHQAGVTIAKELRVEAEEGGKVTLMAKSWEAPVLSLVGVAKVELVGLELSNGSEGLLVGADAQATITNSSLSENGWDGIKLVGSAQATISSSTLSENGYNGIELWGSATVTLKESTVEKNGTSESCAGADWICNGVMVVGESQMTIIDSKIINNADWGVAAVQEKCGYRKDDFTGKVVFEGTNTIEGNNTSGNQNGMGNPGNHYWNQPNVPDGQVCLP